MLFSSWSFLIFLVCTFAVYYLPLGGAKRPRSVFLVLDFVFSRRPWLVLLLGASVLGTSFAAS
jgi:hypothetical protein